MLASVFWHESRAGVAARDYEAAHREFHEVLWRSRVPGLLALRVYRLDVIPWLPGRPSGYEDWHLLEDSAALDRLNEAAVTQARQLPHERIAAMAAGGTARTEWNIACRLMAHVAPLRQGSGSSIQA